MVGKVILTLLRLGVAGVFLYAGVVKIWDFAHGRSATPDFTLAIQHYELLPAPELAVLLAIYLPWLEAIAALALFVLRLALGASLAVAGLTGLFLGALGSAAARGLDVSCGCFGRDEVSVDYRSAILRDVLLLAATIVLVAVEARRTAKA
jgi:uncharacterized membrane protein YphA (DoxX/SURF4 family)